MLPLASQQTQREREEELIFRGLQYAEGIRRFRVKFGRYPTSLKEMIEVEPRTIRKLWRDPITNSDDWGLIFFGQGQTPLTGGVPGPGGQGGPVVGGGSDKGSPFSRPTPRRLPRRRRAAARTTATRAARTSRAASIPPGIPRASRRVPITGVYCKSQAKSIRVYQGRDEYHLWRFTEQTLSDGGRSETPVAAPVPESAAEGRHAAGRRRHRTAEVDSSGVVYVRRSHEALFDDTTPCPTASASSWIPFATCAASLSAST